MPPLWHSYLTQSAAKAFPLYFCFRGQHTFESRNNKFSLWGFILQQLTNLKLLLLLCIRLVNHTTFIHTEDILPKLYHLLHSCIKTKPKVIWSKNAELKILRNTSTTSLSNTEICIWCLWVTSTTNIFHIGQTTQDTGSGYTHLYVRQENWTSLTAFRKTHTPSGPRNVMLSPINNQQQLKKVWHIHSPIIQPCSASTPMDHTREQWTFHSQQSSSHPH